MSFDGHSKTFDKWGEENKRINKETEQILLKRIQAKHPTYTLDDLKKALDHDTILTSADTVALGLADDIL